MTWDGAREVAGWCPNEGPDGGAVWGDAEELAMGVLDACVKSACRASGRLV